MPTDQVTPSLFQSPLIPYLLIFGVFYFLVIKPQRDKQKQHKETIAGVKKNDEITTTGGIHGTVVNVKETTVIIRIDDNAKMEIDKEAVNVVTKKSN